MPRILNNFKINKGNLTMIKLSSLFCEVHNWQWFFLHFQIERVDEKTLLNLFQYGPLYQYLLLHAA